MHDNTPRRLQVATASLYDEITVDTTGKNYPMLAGNLVAICFSGIVCTAVSLMDPDDYDWESTKNIKMVEVDDIAWFNSEDYDEDALEQAKRWIMRMGMGFTFVIVLAWPLLSLPAGVFDKGYFNFWVALSIIWGIVATLFVVLLPLYESKDSIVQVFGGLCGGASSTVSEKPKAAAGGKT